MHNLAKMKPNALLDRLLTTLSVRVQAFAICEIEKGWRLAVEPTQAVVIHYILAGSGTVAVDNGEPVAFGPDCVVVVPAGVSQTFGDSDPCARIAAASDNCKPRPDGLLNVTAGAGEPSILCACGSIAATYAGALGLFDLLREPIVEQASCGAMREIFRSISDEIARPALGTQAVAEALMKQCLVLLLRQHLNGSGAASPFFSALRDCRLTRAVAAVVERPAAIHTVDGLAALAGMSRSTFTERFTGIYRQSPIEFVQNVRLRLAAQLLVSTDMPVKVIAGNVGYGSRSYFTRAFRARYGGDPTTYRRRDGTAEPPANAVGQANASAASRRRLAETAMSV